MNNNIIENFLIGGLSGAISKTLFSPLERIRYLLQTDISNNTLKNIKFKGIVDSSKWVLKNQGILSFWYGNFVNIIRYFPNQGLNLAGKEFFRKKFNISNKNSQKEILIKNFLSGAFATSISQIITYPLEIIRTICVTKIKNKKRIRIISTIKDIYYKNNIYGFYNGFVLNLIGNVVYRAFHFGLYDTFKEYKIFNDSYFSKFLLSNMIMLWIGIFLYPVETVVKNRMLESNNQSKLNLKSKNLFYFIINENGYKGLYKGFLINCLRSIPGSLVLVLFDFLKEKYFKK